MRKELTLGEAVEILKRDTRRYAKRQITWFKRLQDIYWIDGDEYLNQDETFEKIKYYLASYGIFL